MAVAGSNDKVFAERCRVNHGLEKAVEVRPEFHADIYSDHCLCWA